MTKAQVNREALRASFLASAQEVLDGYGDLIDEIEAEETESTAASTAAVLRGWSN